MNLAKTLDYERLKRGMTQSEFAFFLGVPRGTLAHHLTGRRISPKILKRYSEKLDIDLASIAIKEDKQ